MGLLFANLFITSIAAGITFGMVKVLRITWLFVALHVHVFGIGLIRDDSLGMKVSLIAIKYSTSILSLTFIFLFKRLPASGVLNCSAEGSVILLPSVELFCQIWFEKEAVSVKIEEKITSHWLFKVRSPYADIVCL